MNEFKVGEVAIVRHGYEYPEVVGAEVVIVGQCCFHLDCKRRDGTDGIDYGYLCDAGDDEYDYVIDPKFLRKKGREEQASWGRIAEVTGWQPQAVPA